MGVYFDACHYQSREAGSGFLSRSSLWRTGAQTVAIILGNEHVDSQSGSVGELLTK